MSVGRAWKTESKNDRTITAVGSGGDGVVTFGDLLAQAAAYEGLHVVETEAYGPQIRGGEASATVRIAPGEIGSPGDAADVVVVLRWDDFERLRGEIAFAPGALVLHEPPAEGRALPTFDSNTKGLRLVAVPFAEISRTAAGSPSARNIVALGLVASLLGLPPETIRAAVSHRFGSKGSERMAGNERALAAGQAFAMEIPGAVDLALPVADGHPRPLLSGNEAVAVAAIHAGCRFFAGYPITPSTEILQFLAERLPRMGGTVIQTEDEISAIGAVIGASFAGERAMTATSGPGLSLMTEMLGLASMAEVPSVIVDVQRGGPSTGNPTKTEQSDLWHSLYGSHGDAPRVVLACSDVEDAFHATVEAFNIAEEYQIPVILLSDQSIGQRRQTISGAGLEHAVVGRRLPSEDELQGYQRYRETDSGVSPMSVPGIRGGEYQTNGLEHDASGQPASRYLTHESMNAKRYRKLWPIRETYRFVRRFGPERARLGIVCWGSSLGAVREAVCAANARGESVAAFVPRMLYPFPKEDFERFLESVDELLVVELSYTAQFYRYLRSFLDLPKETRVYKRSGGKPLTASEVEESMSRLFDLEPAEALV